MTQTLLREPKHLARSMKEIDKRLDDFTHEDDPFGQRRNVLVYAMDYGTAYRHLTQNNKPTDQQWAMVRMLDVKREALSTFLIVLRDALNHKHAAAQAERLREYVWLLGRDDVLDEMEAALAHPSHLPELRAFAIHMGGRFTRAWMEETDGDDRAARLAAGLPCETDCKECA